PEPCVEAGSARAVDTDAEDRARRARVLARLHQDAAELRAFDNEVVGPLERGLDSELAQGARGRRPGDERQRGELARRAPDAPRERKGEIAGPAVPAPPAPAAARGLLL